MTAGVILISNSAQKFSTRKWSMVKRRSRRTTSIGCNTVQVLVIVLCRAHVHGRGWLPSSVRNKLEKEPTDYMDHP
jgi:hypothetical protein